MIDIDRIEGCRIASRLAYTLVRKRRSFCRGAEQSESIFRPFQLFAPNPEVGSVPLHRCPRRVSIPYPQENLVRHLLWRPRMKRVAFKAVSRVVFQRLDGEQIKAVSGRQLSYSADHPTDLNGRVVISLVYGCDGCEWWRHANRSVKL